MPASLDMGYRPPSDLLKERVILVTGAGDGIGKACAYSLASYGAQVILSGRTLSKLEKVYDGICAQNHPEPMLLPADFAQTQASDYEQIAEAVMARFGGLHGLVNNASILGPRVPLTQYPFDQFEAVLQVNLTSVFGLTQALLPALSAMPDASVVFTSSSVGRKARAYWGAYSVSKFGTEALMGIWADETEKTGDVRFNSLNPGATRTQMRASAYPAEDPEALAAPSDLMPLYLYLMGPDSKGMTGQAFDAQKWQYADQSPSPG